MSVLTADGEVLTSEEDNMSVRAGWVDVTWWLLLAGVNAV
jgi:hypothetical protein